MEAVVPDVSILSSTQTSSFNRKGINLAKAEKAAKDFEAVFMSQMLKPMWEGVKTDGMFGGGVGEDTMRDLLLQEYGKSMVRNDQYGLSPALMDAMIRMQNQADGVQPGPTV